MYTAIVVVFYPIRHRHTTMSNTTSSILKLSLFALVAVSIAGCKSEPAKPRHQRSKDNVLEEYVKVPLDKAKNFKKKSDSATAQKARVYDELGEN